MLTCLVSCAYERTQTCLFFFRMSEEETNWKEPQNSTQIGKLIMQLKIVTFFHLPRKWKVLSLANSKFNTENGNSRKNDDKSWFVEHQTQHFTFVVFLS